MELAYKIATIDELDEILAFGDAQLKSQEPDETARMFKSWHAPWRKESLEHYLKLGWSFVARDKTNNELQGFFIGQVLLFFRNQTQTLWVESLEAKNEEVRQALTDIATRLSREKHLQRVQFYNSNGSVTEVATTKG